MIQSNNANFTSVFISLSHELSPGRAVRTAIVVSWDSSGAITVSSFVSPVYTWYPTVWNWNALQGSNATLRF